MHDVEPLIASLDRLEAAHDALTEASKGPLADYQKASEALVQEVRLFVVLHAGTLRALAESRGRLEVIVRAARGYMESCGDPRNRKQIEAWNELNDALAGT